MLCKSLLNLTMIKSQNFKSLFCERFDCSFETFETFLFWKSVPPGMRPVAFAISQLRPKFFYWDFDHIRQIAQADSKHEITALINALPYDGVLNQGLLRGVLRVRISGHRLMRLAGRSFACKQRSKSPLLNKTTLQEAGTFSVN
jgi:hypothetical protein